MEGVPSCPARGQPDGPKIGIKIQNPKDPKQKDGMSGVLARKALSFAMVLYGFLPAKSGSLQPFLQTGAIETNAGRNPSAMLQMNLFNCNPFPKYYSNSNSHEARFSTGSSHFDAYFIWVGWGQSDPFDNPLIPKSFPSMAPQGNAPPRSENFGPKSFTKSVRSSVGQSSTNPGLSIVISFFQTHSWVPFQV